MGIARRPSDLIQFWMLDAASSASAAPRRSSWNVGRTPAAINMSLWKPIGSIATKVRARTPSTVGVRCYILCQLLQIGLSRDQPTFVAAPPN